jgi:hypothetical protein
MTGTRWIAAAVLLAIPGAAAAAPIYFHKPSVAREAFQADLSECVGLAGGVGRVLPQTVYSPNIYAAAAGAFLAAFMAAKERRHMIDNVLRTCMTDKGYRRVEASQAATASIKKLDQKAREERLYTLASALEPDGKVLPR